MESITSYMEQDHDLIDGFAARALQAAAAGDAGTVQREGGEFLRRLRRHIEIEEDVLFPAFEQRTGMVAAGPSRQMRIEHEMMQPILAGMQQALAAQDGAGFERTVHALLEILEPHNVKEEQMMYPMLDETAGADARGLLEDVKAMAA
jgi:iron-sulfur cluster repair protein YtfE (RIC family)